jgi:Tfp pilus assembly protein PilF
MKSTIFALLGLAVTVATAPVSAREIPADGTAILPVAYEALRDGRAQEAVRLLTATTDVDARDPSRLINLGTAHARLGHGDQAAEMYRAAAASPIRYDLELADGRTMDSRWAARMALKGLATKGRVTIALAN